VNTKAWKIDFFQNNKKYLKYTLTLHTHQFCECGWRLAVRLVRDTSAITICFINTQSINAAADMYYDVACHACYQPLI
jgi:hypothetical protein